MRIAESRSPLSYYAELEAKRFSRSEFYELLSHWFPRTAAFAVMRGNGSIGAIVPDDPHLDLVGRFYVRLAEWEKKRWDAYFSGEGTLRERALGVGLKRRGLEDWKNETMEKLARDFEEIL